MQQDSIQRILEAAETCKGDESVLVPLIDELERRTADGGSGPDVWYATAYVWYLHPRRMQEVVIQKRVDDLLRRVLNAVPEDYLSLLYLGHNKYDCGEYGAATRYFELATRVAPKNYIGLKASEMLVSSRIMELGTAGALEAFEALVKEASYPEYEPEDIWPRELARALECRGVDDLTPDALTKATKLARRLDHLGHLNGWIRGLIRRG